jgi:uncharacterized protein YdeI (YjbR/CyaY-like superfamily)
VKPVFFASAAELAGWLERNHAKADELWVGFHKKASGKGGLTYSEALDEALCIGWIDGVRKGAGEERFTIRFTPRKAKSNWSAVNIRRAGELTKAGRMKPPGAAAFERRQRGPAPYSFENAPRALDAPSDEVLRSSPRALSFFEAQPPSYRRMTTFWVMSAKKEETRARRLRALVECSEKGAWIPPLRWAANAPGRRSASPGKKGGTARRRGAARRS